MPDQYTHAVFITMNEDGDITVSLDGDEAVAECMSNIGGKAYRTGCVHVTMSAPEIPEVEVTIPDEATDVLASVKAED